MKGASPTYHYPIISRCQENKYLGLPDGWSILRAKMELKLPELLMTKAEILRTLEQMSLDNAQARRLRRSP